MTGILGTAQNPTNLSKTTEVLQGPEEYQGIFFEWLQHRQFFEKKSILCWASILVPTSPLSLNPFPQRYVSITQLSDPLPHPKIYICDYLLCYD